MYTDMCGTSPTRWSPYVIHLLSISLIFALNLSVLVSFISLYFRLSPTQVTPLNSSLFCSLFITVFVFCSPCFVYHVLLPFSFFVPSHLLKSDLVVIEFTPPEMSIYATLLFYPFYPSYHLIHSSHSHSSFSIYLISPSSPPPSLHLCPSPLEDGHKCNKKKLNIKTK